MKVTYLVKKSGSSSKKTVFVQFYNKGSKDVFGTRFQIDVNDWGSGEPKRINSTKSLRVDLLDYQAKCETFISDLFKREERFPTSNELKQLIERMNGSTPDKLLVKDVFELYIKDKKRTLSTGTIEITERTMTYLLEMNSKLDFPDFAPPFSSKFQQHLLNKGIQNNSANKYIKKVKAFLNWAKKNEYTNKDYSQHIEVLPTVEPAIYALTNEELEIIETGVTESGKRVVLIERLERIRDLFLFGCYCGLRFEDLMLVSADMIHEGKLYLMDEKTNGVLTIPLLPEATKILMKYEYQLPQISNQKANEYLKELLFEMGIIRKVLEVRQIGSNIIKEYNRICDVITFHKSRKTFIVTALTAGIPAMIVKQLSGHKKDETFNRYVQFSDSVLENEMNKMSRSARTLKIDKAG